MIHKSINDIVQADILALIEQKVPEGKTLEYKRELPGGTDGDKVKFLRAVSSMANTDGGDLIYGVEAKDGIPVAVHGLNTSDADSVKLRFENILRDAIEPRIPSVQFHLVPVSKDLFVLVVRTARSWNGPHRVTLGSHAHFYGRNSAGAYQLDVSQLRTAFTLSENVGVRVREFIADRLMKMQQKRFPVSVVEAGTLVFHVLPLSSFASVAPERIEFTQAERFQFPLMGGSASCQKVNLDGYTVFEERQRPNISYAQIFRSGIVEVVCAFPPCEGVSALPSRCIERDLIAVLGSVAVQLAKKDIIPPFVVSLAFLNVRGYRLHTDNRHNNYSVAQLEDDVLLLPDILIEQVAFDPPQVLRPIFDMLWNTFGYEECSHYDANDIWMPQ